MSVPAGVGHHDQVRPAFGGNACQIGNAARDVRVASERLIVVHKPAGELQAHLVFAPDELRTSMGERSRAEHERGAPEWLAVRHMPECSSPHGQNERCRGERDEQDAAAVGRMIAGDEIDEQEERRTGGSECPKGCQEKDGGAQRLRLVKAVVVERSLCDDGKQHGLGR